MSPGWLVALEGIDGAGTTSQMAPVAEGLAALGYRVVCTREPSDGEIGRWIRHQLKFTAGRPEALDEGSLALMFAADRIDHFTRIIAPALAQGQLVLTDRYVWSSLAYQSAALAPEWVAQINAQAPPAAVNVWFDLPASVAEVRRQSRGAAKERFEHRARQLVAAKRYAALAHGAPAASVLRVDASAPLLAVTAQIVGGLRAHLEAKRPS